jgi:hypothetical protein
LAARSNRRRSATRKRERCHRLQPNPILAGAIDDKNDKLYAADHVDLPDGGSTIYTLDRQTGVLTPVFNTGIAFVHNIAFKPHSDEAPIARSTMGD